MIKKTIFGVLRAVTTDGIELIDDNLVKTIISCTHDKISLSWIGQKVIVEAEISELIYIKAITVTLI